MKRILAPILLLTLLFPSSVFADTYVCVTDQKTGFDYDKSTKKWKQKNFEPKGKYIISKVTSKDVSEDSSLKDHQFKIREFGRTINSHRCKLGFNNYGFLHCDGQGTRGNLKFNNKNLRFVTSFIHGYMDTNHLPHLSDDVYPSAPFVKIGTCSKL